MEEREISDRDLNVEELEYFLSKLTESPLTEIERLLEQQGLLARRQLETHIRKMDPFKFELLIKYLLEFMGYENVEITSKTKDQGVDLVAEIEVGIFRAREAFQVKRQKGNVGRGVLDGLRGSLHRFGAQRASIITTGGFSKDAKDAAFENGTTPITLIDGHRLVEMLVNHNFGISRRELTVLEYDPQYLHMAEMRALKVRKRQTQKKWRW